jgi:hypothetical protein
MEISEGRDRPLQSPSVYENNIKMKLENGVWDYEWDSSAGKRTAAASCKHIQGAPRLHEGQTVLLFYSGSHSAFPVQYICIYQRNALFE